MSGAGGSAGATSSPTWWQLLAAAPVASGGVGSGSHFRVHLCPGMLHINFPKAVNGDFRPFCPGVSSPPHPGTQNKEAAGSSPKLPSPAQPRESSRVPSRPASRLLPEPQGGGPGGAQDWCMSLAGHPMSLSPFPGP